MPKPPRIPINSEPVHHPEPHRVGGSRVAGAFELSADSLSTLRGDLEDIHQMACRCDSSRFFGTDPALTEKLSNAYTRASAKLYEAAGVLEVLVREFEDSRVVAEGSNAGIIFAYVDGCGRTVWTRDRDSAVQAVGEGGITTFRLLPED